ncbi:MAG: hypothetical protein LBT43_04170 [Prevotella sp.]|jgi:hypothetical protein|nr:hypothetical protein [Prevotella sp.]
MNTVEEMIMQYLIAWNQKDLASYKREFSKIWAEGAEYIDQFGHYNNVEELAAFAYESLKIIPDRVFAIHKKAEHHHNYGKYEWKATFGDGINIGVDFFEYDDNFKITKLVSFFSLPEDYPVEKLG